MPKYNSACLLSLLALILCLPARAQSGDGRFGCPARTQLFEHVDVEFTPLNEDAIELWKNRPGLAFEGFDEKKYGFRQIAFYRWREPLQQDGDSPAPVSTASLAVRLVGSRIDQWFEWRQSPSVSDSSGSATPNDLLSIQADPGNESPEQLADTVAQTFIIRPATTDPALPLFLLEFGYSGSNGTVVNRLLLDGRSGSPQIGKAVQCLEAAPAGGACDVLTRAGSDNLSCAWEAASADFRCSRTSPFGDNSPRMSRAAFYLFSAKPAALDWSAAQTLPDVGELAVELSKSRAPANAIMVPDLGPVTLLARYKDLLPGDEVFLFASPGSGATVNAHFSLVRVSAQGRATVQDIPKSVLSGEKTDESQRPVGFTPVPGNDRYRTMPLADRPGFHALEAVMTVDSAAEQQPPVEPTHVVYWIGIEAVGGKLVPSAVRVASDGLSYGSCAQEAHDGSAISIEPQQGMVAATVHVRPPDIPANTTPQEAEQSDTLSGCVWIGALYWKPETGFQVRKVDDECASGVPQVSISEDGQIAVKTIPPPEQ
jgi:hypothetical protein